MAGVRLWHVMEKMPRSGPGIAPSDPACRGDARSRRRQEPNKVIPFHPSHPANGVQTEVQAVTRPPTGGSFSEITKPPPAGCGWGPSVDAEGLHCVVLAWSTERLIPSSIRQYQVPSSCSFSIPSSSAALRSVDFEISSPSVRL